MRLSIALLVVVAGCPGPANKSVNGPVTEPVAEEGPPQCKVITRRLSAVGISGVRPSLAAVADRFAVVWEESVSAHRGIHFQALDAAALPLSPSVEVADLQKGGAEPRVVADGDGFAVLWTVEQAETSVIAFRRLDGRGKPRSDVVPAISAPSARALSVARVQSGFAVGWWTWASSPPLQAVTFLDGSGRPLGRPIELARSTLADPAIDLLAEDGTLVAAWEEQRGGEERVVTARLSKEGIAARLDVGPGDTPSLAQMGVVFARLDDSSIWWSPLAEARPARFTDGLYPDAAPAGKDRAILCVVRAVSTEEESFDELDCLDLFKGEPVRDDMVARTKRGLVAQQVAPLGEGYGVVYQTQEDDGMAVHFASVKCPPPVKH